MFLTISLHSVNYLLDISIDNSYYIKELLHSLITAGFWGFENIGSNYAILLLKCILKPITIQKNYCGTVARENPVRNLSRTNMALLYNLLFITPKRMLTYLLELLCVIRNTWITCYWSSFLSAVSITSTKFSLIQRHTSWNLQPQETSSYCINDIIFAQPTVLQNRNVYDDNNSSIKLC